MSKTEEVDVRTKYLIFGYIRLIKIYEQVIPTEIIQLIIQFHYYKLLIIYLQQNGLRKDKKPPIINILDFEKKQNNKCIVKPLDIGPFGLMKRSQSNRYYTMNSSNYVCHVKDFKIPQNILQSFDDKLYKNQRYNVIFSICAQNICYIIDPLNIGTANDVNIYCWRLPTEITFAQSFALYSPKHGLMSIGNFFSFLSFDEDEIISNNWNWKRREMPTNRMLSAATMISDDKLICCGGCQNERKTDIYDFNTKKWGKLADMNYDREWSGIHFDENKNKNIYIGGGEDASKQFECYDINKNKWISLSDTNVEHCYYPIIWTDNVNTINIASTYGETFERMDIRENKWNVYIKNDDNNKAFDDLFGVKISDDLECRLCL